MYGTAGVHFTGRVLCCSRFSDRADSTNRVFHYYRAASVYRRATAAVTCSVWDRMILGGGLTMGLSKKIPPQILLASGFGSKCNWFFCDWIFRTNVVNTDRTIYQRCVYACYSNRH